MGKSVKLGTEVERCAQVKTGSGVPASAHTASARLSIDCPTSTATIPTFPGSPRTFAIVLEVWKGHHSADLPPHVTSRRVFLRTVSGLGNAPKPLFSPLSTFSRYSTALLLLFSRELWSDTICRSFVDASIRHRSRTSPTPVAPNLCATLLLEWREI